ncbi:MAG: 50S ribosomal protein L19 [Elusimicrobiota bacterium]
MVNIIDEQLRKDIPDFNPGDEIEVIFKVGKDHQRTQAFRGVVISYSGEGIDKTFTVRKQSFGVGVEKIFPYHSPLIEEIKVLRKGKVRRSKLYYLREKYGKAAKIKEKTDY